MNRTCWLICAVVALGAVLLLWRLDVVNGDLETELLAHAATAQERDRWKAAAEEYRQNAEAQAENARQCLDREAKATMDAAERAAIVKQVKPRPRTTEEKDKVVDDETRNAIAGRLNRPL